MSSYKDLIEAYESTGSLSDQIKKQFKILVDKINAAINGSASQEIKFSISLQDFNTFNLQKLFCDVLRSVAFKDGLKKKNANKKDITYNLETAASDTEQTIFILPDFLENIQFNGSVCLNFSDNISFQANKMKAKKSLKLVNHTYIEVQDLIHVNRDFIVQDIAKVHVTKGDIKVGSVGLDRNIKIIFSDLSSVNVTGTIFANVTIIKPLDYEAKIQVLHYCDFLIKDCSVVRAKSINFTDTFEIRDNADLEVEAIVGPVLPVVNFFDYSKRTIIDKFKDEGQELGSWSRFIIAGQAQCRVTGEFSVAFLQNAHSCLSETIPPSEVKNHLHVSKLLMNATRVNAPPVENNVMFRGGSINYTEQEIELILSLTVEQNNHLAFSSYDQLKHLPELKGKDFSASATYTQPSNVSPLNLAFLIHPDFYFINLFLKFYSDIRKNITISSSPDQVGLEICYSPSFGGYNGSAFYQRNEKHLKIHLTITHATLFLQELAKQDFASDKLRYLSIVIEEDFFRDFILNKDIVSSLIQIGKKAVFIRFINSNGDPIERPNSTQTTSLLVDALYSNDQFALEAYNYFKLDRRLILPIQESAREKFLKSIEKENYVQYVLNYLALQAQSHENPFFCVSLRTSEAFLKLMGNTQSHSGRNEQLFQAYDSGRLASYFLSGFVLTQKMIDEVDDLDFLAYTLKYALMAFFMMTKVILTFKKNFPKDYNQSLDRFITDLNNIDSIIEIKLFAGELFRLVEELPKDSGRLKTDEEQFLNNIRGLWSILQDVLHARFTPFKDDSPEDKSDPKSLAFFSKENEFSAKVKKLNDELNAKKLKAVSDAKQAIAELTEQFSAAEQIFRAQQEQAAQDRKLFIGQRKESLAEIRNQAEQKFLDEQEAKRQEVLKRIEAHCTSPFAASSSEETTKSRKAEFGDPEPSAPLYNSDNETINTIDTGAVLEKRLANQLQDDTNKVIEPPPAYSMHPLGQVSEVLPEQTMSNEEQVSVPLEDSQISQVQKTDDELESFNALSLSDLPAAPELPQEELELLTLFQACCAFNDSAGLIKVMRDYIKAKQEATTALSEVSVNESIAPENDDDFLQSLGSLGDDALNAAVPNHQLLRSISDAPQVPSELPSTSLSVVGQFSGANRGERQLVGAKQDGAAAAFSLDSSCPI